MSNSIFVQIACYRDPQLIPTIMDMASQAKHPENLTVGICWQHSPDETFDNFTDVGFKNVGELVVETVEHPITVFKREDGMTLQVIDVHFQKSKGACWARNQIQQMYDNQKYTMQLDSHHRFVEGWDDIVINMLESLRPYSKKPLLTGYIPSFDPENDPAQRATDPWKMDFDRFIPEGAVFFLPATIDDWKERELPVKARFFSAHFAFADGSFAVDVQHDPQYFFHGEEISIAVRAFTHGYDLYHPHLIIAYHEYTRKGRVKVWDDHTTGQKNKGRIELDWVERNDICHKRNRILFGMDGEDPKQIDFGKYGFGTERTLQDYEQYSGLSFKYRGVQQETLDKKYYPPNSMFTYSREFDNTPEDQAAKELEWKNSIVRSNDIRVCVHKDELKDDDGVLADDFDFFYAGAHDKNGVEIHRKDLQEEEIKNFLQHSYIDYQMIFFSDKQPAGYTLWTHSKSRGWGKKLDKPVHVPITE